MVAQAIHETISGTVTRVNSTGFQLQGTEGWLNLSRFAKPMPLLPHAGMQVSVGLDKSGYVRTVSELRDEPAETLGQAGELLYFSDAQRSPELRHGYP